MASRSPQEAQKKRVAVIGAGAAGLIAAKYLLAGGLHVTLYERMSEVGGVWYSYDQMFPTNAYDNLETNIPRHLMTFSGQPWPTSTPIFPGKDIVAGYLRCLADDLLNKHSDDFQLQLHTEVTSLRHVLQSTDVVGWKITARTWEAEQVLDEMNEFGSVVVSTGIYTKEFIPASYEGIQSWRGSYGDTELHSKTFRNAGNFKYKKVLVVGNSASGWDISKQLVGVADCVTVSTQRPSQRLSDDSHIKKGPIRRFLSQSGEVEFEDGTVSRFDNIIWCTGYTYDFAFIKNSVYGKLFKEDFRVTDTYKHIFYIPQLGKPSLAFVGLLKMVPWTVLELQGSLIASVFAGRGNTPSRRNMKDWEQDTINAWRVQCEADPGLERMFHALNWVPLPHMVSGDQVDAYMAGLYEWMTSSAAARVNQNARPRPPSFCARMNWIRRFTAPVRNAVLQAGFGRMEHDRLDFYRRYSSLADYGFYCGEDNCHCSDNDALCKTAFALDD